MRNRSANLGRAVILAVPPAFVRSDLIHRPGDGTSLQAAGVLRCPILDLSSLPQAAAAAWLAVNGVLSFSILCRTTASFRARATLALRMPARLARRAAQLLSSEPFTGPGQNDIGRFVECGAHVGVTDFGDPPGHV